MFFFHAEARPRLDFELFRITRTAAGRPEELSADFSRWRNKQNDKQPGN